MCLFCAPQFIAAISKSLPNKAVKTEAISDSCIYICISAPAELLNYLTNITVFNAINHKHLRGHFRTPTKSTGVLQTALGTFNTDIPQQMGGVVLEKSTGAAQNVTRGSAVLVGMEDTSLTVQPVTEVTSLIFSVVLRKQNIRLLLRGEKKKKKKTKIVEQTLQIQNNYSKDKTPIALLTEHRAITRQLQRKFK